MLTGFAKGVLGVFVIAATTFNAGAAILVSAGTGTVNGVTHQANFGDFGSFSLNPQTVSFSDTSSFSFTITAPTGYTFSISTPGAGSHLLVFGTGLSGFTSTGATVVSSQVSFANVTGIEPTTGLFDLSKSTSGGLFLEGQIPVSSAVTFTSLTYTVTFQGSYTASNVSVSGWELGLVNSVASTPQLLKIQQMSAIPEPGTLGLGVLGLVAFGGALRRRRRKAA
jgi:hypothetical protein